MSLIKKSDVKNHLRTGASGKLLPFVSRSQPDATGYSNIGNRDVPVNTSEAVPGSEQLLEPSTVKVSQA
jgi:hypothetical protein